MQGYFSKQLLEADGSDASTIFDKSFAGVLAHEEVYYNPWTKKDKSELIGKALLQKAGASITTTTGGAGTAGYALIPVWVDTNIVDRTKYETPIRAMIPRMACKGMTYDYNVRTAKAGASWKTEDGSYADDVDTYDRASVGIKFGYSIGRLTGPAIAAMRGYVDAQALDLDSKTQALFELEEDTIINGDATTYPTEYNGLINTITTNTTNLSSTSPTLAKIRTELATCYQAKGKIVLAITDAFTHNYIKGLLMDFQRQPAPPSVGLPFGIPDAFSFDGVNFIRSQFMPTTSGSRRILFLDPRYIFMAVLQDITFKERSTLNDSVGYALSVYEALVVTFEACMSQMYGIL